MCAQGYREDVQLLLESDADEQLILHLNFNTAVRLHALTIAGPADGHAPQEVRQLPRCALPCDRSVLQAIVRASVVCTRLLPHLLRVLGTTAACVHVAAS